MRKSPEILCKRKIAKRKKESRGAVRKTTKRRRTEGGNKSGRCLVLAQDSFSKKWIA